LGIGVVRETGGKQITTHVESEGERGNLDKDSRRERGKAVKGKNEGVPGVL